MSKRYLLGFFVSLWVCSSAWAASDLAPAMPELNLPPETPAPVAAQAPAVAPQQAAASAAAAPKKASAKKANTKKTSAKAAAPAAKKASVPPVTNTVTKVNTEKIEVENLIPQQQIQPVATLPTEGNNAAAAPVQNAAPAADAAPAANTQPVAAAADLAKQTTTGGKSQAVPAQKLVQYNPPTDRDPTLSQDDTLLLKHREEERLRALEAERQRRLAEERRRLAELERQRQLELERLRDPSREVRGKIRVSGIIGQEVFIGNKIYSVGKSIYGARIVKVLPDSVVFTYKGQQFTKKVDLQ